MGFYSKYVLPKLVHFTCGSKPTTRQRNKVVPLARGRVLEVGVGSGLNFPFYDPTSVSKVWGLDPSPELIRMAEQAALAVPFEVEFIGLPSDVIPLADDSVDTVLITYTLCTIPDTTPALREMSRVLRPGGRLVFCEHGAAPDASVRRWQDRVNPLWRRLSGGCELNRPIPALIERGGFRIAGLDTMYIPGWRPACFNYWGIATPQ
jgi:ubiquinone/menaquinone biosynthesis C-methylase UbiE